MTERPAPPKAGVASAIGLLDVAPKDTLARETAAAVLGRVPDAEPAEA
jgi:hypothetical protein